MITPEQAFDILFDQLLLEDFVEERGMSLREARRLLLEIAQPIFDGSAPLPASPLLRAARAAGSRGRADVEELVAFVEKVVRLPDRVLEVFRACVVEGLSLSQCADRLGISRNTVRAHLRRLRLLMRRASLRVADQDTVPFGEVNHGSSVTHD